MIATLYRWFSGRTLERHDANIVVRSAGINDYILLSRMNADIFGDSICLEPSDLLGTTLVYIACIGKPVGFIIMEDCDDVVIIRKMGATSGNPAVYRRLVSIITPGMRIGAYTRGDGNLASWYESNGFRLVSVTPSYRYYER